MKKDTANKNWFLKHKVLTGFIVLFGLITVGASLGEKEDTSLSPNTTQSQSVTSDNTSNKTEETKKESQEPSVPADYKSALSKANSYAKNMHMSKVGVYDQLTSEYGEKFSAEAAQYAIDNVQADWNANALAKAKSYQSNMSMSPSAIRDQLVSEHGEKFTAEEADYAIAHLND